MIEQGKTAKDAALLTGINIRIGKWSSWNKNRAFPRLDIQCDGVLDRNDMKGNYLVMDSAPIQTSVKVRELVESRGYKCLYLPPYSPFLNRLSNSGQK